MFAGHKQKAIFLFALADVILTIVTFEAAYELRVFLPLEHAFFLTVPIKALILGVTLVIWVGLGYLLRLYERLETAEVRSALNDSLKQVVTGILFVVAFLFLMKLDISRAFIVLFGAFNLLALIAFRVSARPVRGYLRRQFGAISYVAIAGTGPGAQQLGRAVEDAQEDGVKLLAFIDVGDSRPSSLPPLEGAYPVWQLKDLPGLLQRNVVDEIIFAVERETLPQLQDVFLLCDEEGIRTRVLVDFFPHVNSEVYLEQFGPFPLLTFSATPHDEIRLLFKRGFDFALASLALLLAAAPMALFALLVRLTSPGPAIFRQIRCGLNGRRFTFYKLRSMCADAENKKASLADLNESSGPVFKMANDPRLTPLGRYLRRYSIDEWPQLWNVLRGDMSFVGPRPAVPSEVENYRAWQRRRLRMKPGLTCLWVLEGRSELDFDTWMRLDMEYIDNWSLLLDLKILLRSIPLVLTGRGAS